MKIAALLAEYLNRHGQLDLPGVGSFRLGPGEGNEGSSPDGLEFSYNPAIKENTDLVDFIAGDTGKLKALAAADLDSHLAQVRQFLNIGKPFLFEGIGSLIKLQTGEYALATGNQFHEKMKAVTAREIQQTATPAESFSQLGNKKGRTGDSVNRWRRPLIGLIVLAGLALAVWGGYIIYKMAVAKNKRANKNDLDKVEPVSLADTSQQRNDTIKLNQVVTNQAIPAGN